MSVGQLYPYALAEGEGVGTAYEYLAKRLVLARWMGRSFKPKRILVAGAPEKYGSSLDFALMAHEYGAHLTVSDERPDALSKFERGLSKMQSQGYLTELRWETRKVAQLSAVGAQGDRYDLALSSEVLQRLAESEQQRYVACLRQSASWAALFCPNGSNRSHADLSGLDGVTLEELESLTDAWADLTGFIDMPPFPPGLSRSDEQRKQAATGRLEAMVMAGLGVYVRLERFVPDKIRRRQSHIVYALSRPS